METAPHYHGHRTRLRERFTAADGVALPDYELLELLLFSVYPRRDIKPLAKALLATFNGLAGVFHASHAELKAVDGVGETAAIFIRAMKEVAIRLTRAEVMNRDVFNSWEKVLSYFRLQCGYEKVEQFRILFLDKKNHLIADEVQQKGTVDHASVYPREVVKRALDVGASALILLHNHPSGDPSPSSADIDVTLRIADAARPLGIQIHDHIVITRSSHCSLKAMGLI